MKRKLLIIFMSLAAFAAPFFMVNTAAAEDVPGSWVNSATIRVGNENFRDTNNDGVFQNSDTGSSCPSRIQDFNSDKTRASILRPGRGPGSQGCRYGVDTLILSSANNASTNGGGASTGVAPASAQTTAQTTNNANAEEGGKECEELSGVMGWIICPVILMLDSGMNWIDTQIQELLTVESSLYDNQGLKDASANIRRIAFIILVPVLLIMVIGTALGFSAIDAYTVKKALPRLVVAVMFISLSYYICTFLIEFFNVVGRGILGLFTAPFGESVDTLSLADLFGGSVFNSILALPFVTVGAIILFSLFYTTLFLFAGIAYLVLVVRQILIVALLLLAPLAIIAWIFPGNDKLWRSWWGIFSKLLIMFPLIMVVLATGRIFAFIIQQGGYGEGNGSFMDPALKLSAYMLPYAAIPFTFRFAGGVFATLSGAVNDKSKGLFDRARKSREAKRERMGSNQWVNPNTRFGASKWGRRINTAGSWGVSPGSNLAYASKDSKIPILNAKGRQIASHLEEKGIEHSKKLFQKINEAGANDKTFRALSGAWDGFSADTKEKLVDAGYYALDQSGNKVLNPRALNTEADIGKVADILHGSSVHSEQLAGGALHRVAPIIANTYTDPEMNKANVAAAGLLGLAAHGFMGGEDIERVGGIMTQEKDFHFAENAVVQAELAGQRSRPDVKPGYGHAVRDGKIIDGMSAEGGRAADLIKTLSSQDLAAAKGGAFEKLKPTLKKVLDQGGPEATAVKDQLFQWAGPYSQASVDVKAKALSFIDEMSGGEAAKVRTETGQFVYPPGTLGEQFDKATRSGLSPEQLELMRARGEAPPDPGQQPQGQ